MHDAIANPMSPPINIASSESGCETRALNKSKNSGTAAICVESSKTNWPVTLPHNTDCAP